MSVDRNYTFQISATTDSAAVQLGQRERANASPEDRTHNASKRDPSEIIEGANNLGPGAALSREIDGTLSDLRKSGAISSPKLSTSLEDKIDATFPEEYATDGMRHPGAFRKGTLEFASDHPAPLMSNEPSRDYSNANALGRSELANQVRQLQASFHAQAPLITRQDLAEMLSAVHQLKEVFLERQQKSVTRQELKSELQALRLVMEGRK